MKTEELTTENTIAVSIKELRDRFPRTQDLYREVCVLLFFRHGITPTVNKLYQLVRKGSMSAPAEALNKFWNYKRWLKRSGLCMAKSLNNFAQSKLLPRRRLDSCRANFRRREPP